MQNFIDTQQLIKLSDSYNNIRNDLVNKFNSIIITDVKRESYIQDVEFGLLIYEYFQDSISMRIAASDDFWRHLSVEVIPHIVAKRWGIDNEDRFWKKSRRIWLKQIWWYIYLTWGGTIEETKKILMSKNMNTDIILNLVERSGKKGYFVDVQRLIIKYYSNLSNYNGESLRNIFRRVMILNTSKSLLIEPSLCLGGTEGYVKRLFLDLNIQIT